MAEYIEREALQQDIHLRYCKDCNHHNEVKCKACWVDDMLDEITEAPTADVVEVKHGVWLDDIVEGTTVAGINFKGMVGYICSLCGRSEIKKEPYCNCGAKMGGERK